MGIFAIKEKKQHELMNFYENPALIPFTWHFLITMLMIMFMANIDVISFQLNILDKLKDRKHQRPRLLGICKLD